MQSIKHVINITNTTKQVNHTKDYIPVFAAASKPVSLLQSVVEFVRFKRESWAKNSEMQIMMWRRLNFWNSIHEHDAILEHDAENVNRVRRTKCEANCYENTMRRIWIRNEECEWRFWRRMQSETRAKILKTRCNPWNSANVNWCNPKRERRFWRRDAIQNASEESRTRWETTQTRTPLTIMWMRCCYFCRSELFL